MHVAKLCTILIDQLELTLEIRQICIEIRQIRKAGGKTAVIMKIEG